MANLGTDIGDFDALGTLITGRPLLAKDIAWRFVTDEGSLFTDRKYGYNLHQFLNDPISAERLVAIKGRCEVEAMKDARVKKATADVALTNLDGTKRKLSLALNLEDAEGPFTFVVAVTSDGFTIDLFTSRG